MTLKPGYYTACCMACGVVQDVHSNAHWSKCKNRDCGISMKINHAGTKQDLIDCERAIRRLIAGDFKVI